MRRLIFFDIDGTLLDEEKQLPSSAKQAVRQLQEAGHEVAIATGRAPFMFEPLRRELGIDTYVTFNGQYAVVKGMIVRRNPLPAEVFASLVRFAEGRRHPLVYMDAEHMKMNVEDHAYVRESISSLKAERYPEYHPSFFQDREIYQSLLFCTDDEEHAYDGTFPALRFVRWHEKSMDVLPAEGSKAAGLDAVIRHLGFAPEQVVAFGDGLNDVEMLRFVETSVAMGNAPEAVKHAARYVTKDVAEDGIAHGLEMLGILK
ncbi:Cof-type HAD-IIB family hydrolase [Ectobacillus ponti]|uniref:Cof-type HAD-IIB family hydrolase n=1 Tax=Ectobacillus ponti TaxID=2961894 RepID=A0AA41X671_9BACI|nr:Cof-type HAD-IIB family hydrolase [Ectobacillus ponti]MCP8969527.1 Cof-type HAD-IIB family hydrolase [Ectobacillus ponti]